MDGALDPEDLSHITQVLEGCGKAELARRLRMYALEMEGRPATHLMRWAESTVRALDSITRELEDAAAQRRDLQRVTQDLQIAVGNVPSHVRALLDQHDTRSEARTGRAMEELERLARIEASRQEAELEQSERLSRVQIEQAQRLQELEIEERRNRMDRWKQLVSTARDTTLELVRDPWVRLAIVALIINGFGLSLYQFADLTQSVAGTLP